MPVTSVLPAMKAAQPVVSQAQIVQAAPMLLASSTSSRPPTVCKPVPMDTTETLPTTSAKLVMVPVPSAMEPALPTATHAQAATICNMALITASAHALMDNTQFPRPICVCLATPTAKLAVVLQLHA